MGFFDFSALNPGNLLGSHARKVTLSKTFLKPQSA